MTSIKRYIFIIIGLVVFLKFITYASCEDNPGANSGASAMPPLEFGWGTPPRSLVHARNVQSLISAYCWGTDRLIEHSLSQGQQGYKGLLARLAKAPVDYYVSAFIVSLEHEVGHLESARIADSHDNSLVIPFDSGHNFGLEMAPYIYDFNNMNPGDQLQIVSDGTTALQAGLDDMTRREFGCGAANHWSFYLIYLERKNDISTYIFDTARPIRRDNSPFSGSSDIMEYTDAYAIYSNQQISEIHDKLVLGALYNLLDPQVPIAVYQIFNYFAYGVEYSKVPMFAVTENLKIMPGTNFWLARNGPQYRQNLYLTDGQNKYFTQISASYGDMGQWTLENHWTIHHITNAVDLNLFGGIWKQRLGTTPGALHIGSALGIGGVYNINSRFYLSADGGYKTWGSLLGYEFDESPFINGFVGIRL